MCLKKYRVTLSVADRLVIKNLSPSPRISVSKLRRAMILSSLDESGNGCRLSEDEIATAFGTTTRSLYTLRKRFVEDGLEAAIHGIARDWSPTPPKLDGQMEAHLVALACSKPPEGYGAWSLRLLGDRFVELGHCGGISHETVRGVLKKTNSSLGQGNII